ncbi:NrfD/PsrC family molybdoenzyme membrane anchor subunit [Azospirillum sp. SYSU D00513]|uniref:NrfD/PsrC family molybdoenzyme membrane anchor subunit n=1 Tax=Azospirillum sp. SYSU D00513 TaxID=2812561 RepID=UPI001A96BB47|nr:NrfD/PsrC family molybdoenzyme membrane anchor subunit [Azospirillum sp. SYSU D00513]
MSVERTALAGRHPPHRHAGLIVLDQPFTWRWMAAFGAAALVVLLFGAVFVHLMVRGTGIWGTNIPYVWAFDITLYVYWIGVANAASLLSAVLVLRGTQWRSATNRAAEAVALFAVICAGLFPIVHLGRPWLFYWVFPYPATFGVWPQFRSPLVWDFFAINAHLIVTALFWYVGMIPDLAHLRDHERAGRRSRLAFGLLALGWRGSARQWRLHRSAYHLLAGLVVVLVIFMQSTASFEFAVTVVPEWHQTRLPPYFVVSGLMSGLALVLGVLLLMERFLVLHPMLAQRPREVIGWLLVANGIVMLWAYGFDAYSSWYSGPTQREAFVARVTGAFAPLYWGALLCTAGASQLLWVPRIRHNAAALLAVALAISAGLWLDRFMVVVGGLYHTHLPSARGSYTPTLPEIGLLVGSLGLFAMLILLFVRFVPVIFLFEAQAEHRREEEP